MGEITTNHNNPKQLIDTYGTFAFAVPGSLRAQEIRYYTERPRSEFFAIRHLNSLGHILRQPLVCI